MLELQLTAMFKNAIGVLKIAQLHKSFRFFLNFWQNIYKEEQQMIIEFMEIEKNSIKDDCN